MEEYSVNMTEISQVLARYLKEYQPSIEVAEVGEVMQASDGIARIKGLPNVMAMEMVFFERSRLFGIAMNLDEETVSVVLLGDPNEVRQGDMVRCTGRILEVPTGNALLGRVVDPLGQPLDGKGPIKTDKFMPVERLAPSVIERQPVHEPMQTGIKAIDSMLPIGRGQRELVIGDRKTGKTTLLVDSIINQKKTDVICIYVAIGQKSSTVAQVVDKFHEHGAMEYTIVMVAPANAPAAVQYIAPYAGCAMGEYFMFNGKHVLICYDDLSKHAQSYRQVSLLLRRPPGREAYPGDIFYLHSRLLERAAKLNDQLGAGSLTAIPVIETQEGEVSAYIPTNVISITDGQIFLEPGLFYAGVRPAINVGISVSRVGGRAHTQAMKQVAGRLRLDLAQYRELEAFAQFGSDLDESSVKQLERGARTVEVLKQLQYQPMPLEEQVVILFAVVNGFLDIIPVRSIKDCEARFLSFMRSNSPDIMDAVKNEKALSQATIKKLEMMIGRFLSVFKPEEEAAASLVAENIQHSDLGSKGEEWQMWMDNKDKTEAADKTDVNAEE